MPASRRAVLAAGLFALTGCTTAQPPRPPVPTTEPTSTSAAPITLDGLAELERRFDARLGVHATRGARVVEHRADDRFAFCSLFKALATAAVLARHPLSHLDDVIRYTRADLLDNARITPANVDSGMSVRALADAAIRHSDGTAGNLLLRDLGGPAELTAYARELGDTVTRMDRVEPDITEATPGDPRDTTSPRAFGTSFSRVVLGDALPEDKRAVLVDLLVRNTTGARRTRARVPAGWRIANKTGTGDYATANDVAVLWPPTGDPVTLAIMSSRADRTAERDEALVAEAAGLVLAALG
ncbi:class A beta-lactamase [Actinokineospora pegani]|uniref:class A beta-lactamase n=1 Tax=Actinokineospora pegani TaxID=2654637 RepID=UPI0012E99B29|nr:class A beta-lactamase [Actinokineospora pegani]